MAAEQPPDNVFDLTEESLELDHRSVLILEDDLCFADALRVFLESNLFKVTCVNSGVEGLRKVMVADYDLVLCDLVMPNVPGDMFFLAVERTKPHLCRRFVFMTGHEHEPKWEEFLARTRNPVLRKPFSLKDLLARLEERLSRERS